MWQVDENELVIHFRQPGGKSWAEYANNLLYAAAWQLGIPESDVQTCLRTEIGDGGVDTRIVRGSVDDATGFLLQPTIWQYKAAGDATVTEASIATEVNKKYAKERIEAGDAYRLCVCAHVTSDRRSEIEGWLDKAVKKIAPQAAQAKLVAASDVARMAGHFPSFVEETKGRDIQKGTYTLESWGRNATARTKHFIPNEEHEAYRAQILQHVAPDQNPIDPILPILGLAGIGKTRCVYEALRTLRAADGLVLYIDNEQEAAGIATALASMPRVSAVLVVDDRSLNTRYRLHQALVGHRKRVRVLTIEHDAPMERQTVAEVAMEKYGEADVEKIMRANYPGLAPERLRAYASLSSGFLRLAIDLCERDREIIQAQSLYPADLTIRMYYEQRAGAERDFVSALALFTRVGREGDVSGELDALCSWRQFTRSDVEQRFAALKDSPGFVARTAVYYRVSPELIAMQAFDDAWRKWASGREERFLREIQQLPEELQKSFLNRVSRSANKEVRETVRNFFRSYARDFSGRNLGDLAEVFRLRALIEVDPDFYLPYLRSAILHASDEELRGPQHHYYGWEPRRQLVYIADQLAQFRAYFPDAEAMLYRLANVENEPKIGNNATNTWQRLFRPQLSGTALSFKERLEVLIAKLPKPEEPLTPLLAGALEKLFDFHGTRLLGSALIAGRIPDPEWRFTTRDEVQEYVRSTLGVLVRLSQERIGRGDAQVVNDVLVSAVDTFVRQGFLEEVKDAVTSETIPTTLRAELHARFILFLGNADKFGLPPALTKRNYSEDLTTWLSTFKPVDLLGRIIVHVSNGSWAHHEADAPWRATLAELAQELYDKYVDGDPEFEEVLRWLHSDKARGAIDLAFELGKKDHVLAVLSAGLEAAIESKRADFVRGLTRGYLDVSADNAAALNATLDRLEHTHPEICFYLAQVMGDTGFAFERTIRLIRGGSLSPLFLANFSVWIGGRRITQPEIAEAVDTLLPYVKADVPRIAETVIEFIAYQYHGEGREGAPVLDCSFDQLAFKVLVETIKESAGQAFWWGEVAKRILPELSPRQASDLLGRAMVGDNVQIREIADDLLGRLAAEYLDDVIAVLGMLVLSDEHGWRFGIDRTEWLLAIPTEVISKWLDENGSRAALAMARHVPAPSLTDEGEAVLHPLTELLLSRFGNDEDVFREFVAGVHSLQTYMGDIAGQKEQEALDAEKFLHHPLPAVRRWAEIEIASGQRDAQLFRAQEDKRWD